MTCVRRPVRCSIAVIARLASTSLSSRRKTNGLVNAVAAGLIDTGGAGAGAVAMAGAGSGAVGSGRSTFAGGATFAVCEGCAGGGAIEGRAGRGDGAGGGNIAGSGGGVVF